MHSAFTFSNESLVLKSPETVAQHGQVPPGALVSIVQRGLLYLQVEREVDNIDVTQKSESQSPVLPSEDRPQPAPTQAIWRTIANAQSVRYSKWTAKHDKNREDDNEEAMWGEPDAKRKRSAVTNVVDTPATEYICESEGVTKGMRQGVPGISEGDQMNRASQDQAWKEGEQPSKVLEGSTDQSQQSAVHTGTPSHRVAGTHDAVVPLERKDGGVVDEDTYVAPEDVTTLSGHAAEVFCCAWHPCDDVLASGSGDSTVRLWDMRLDPSSTPDCRVLEIQRARPDAESPEEDRDVTTLEWSVDGMYLASGCMDGVARLWTKDGALKHELSAHSESIFSLRFDDRGQCMLTGSYDKCVSVWDVKFGRLRAKFEAHTAQVLDVDWKHGRLDTPSGDMYSDDYLGREIFASCSTDRTIAVCCIPPEIASESSNVVGEKMHSGCTYSNIAGCSDPDVQEASHSHITPQVHPAHLSASTSLKPMHVLSGHMDEVNAIRWDPTGSLLASCSDDRSVLLWRLGVSTPIRSLQDHSEEIYTIRWAPTGPTSQNPQIPLRLASASFDATVKLWDVEVGFCASTLKKHDKKVYTIAFSPSGDLIASGSLGGQVNIWNVSSGTLVKSFLARNSRLADRASYNSVVSNSTSSSGCSADIFEVAWNASGTRLAATSTDAVTVIDLYTMKTVDS